MSFDLIIWDCDGCLVDSEVIACGLAARSLSEWGYPITTDEFIDRFAGKSAATVAGIIHQETGRGLEPTVTGENIKELAALFEKELRPAPHLLDILPTLSAAMCVASGSSIERNTHALKITGLWPFFQDKIYSAKQVARGKPAPDVFLFAADQMKTTPQKCLVIEDSVPGVQAAKAAGMTVFAYMGASHVSSAWRERVTQENPDLLFDDMRLLPSLMAGGA